MNLFIKQLQTYNISLGASRYAWNSHMSLFILGMRGDLFCLNLQYSAICIKKILNVMQRIAKKKKIILFVIPPFVYLKSVLKQDLNYTKQLLWNLKNISLLSVVNWFFGLLTNFKVVNKNYKILPINRLPDILFVLVNKITEVTDFINIAREGFAMNLLTFGLTDSSQNPYTYHYTIPSNSKAFETITFFYRFFCCYFFILNLRLYSNFFSALIKFKLKKR